MKHTKLYIRFFVVISKVNNRGTCPIYCKISYNKKAKKFSTGMFIKPADWDKELQAVRTTDMDYYTTNGLIHSITSKLLKIELELHLKDNDFTLNNVYNKYNNRPERESYGVCEYYAKYIKNLEDLIGKDLKLSTWKKYMYNNQHLKEFVQSKYGKDVSLKKLNITFIEEFEYWLKVSKNQKQITINKSLQRFRKPIRIAASQGLIKIDPFSSHKVKTVKNEVVFLNTEELKLFEETPLSQSRLEKVRKLFVFCCYSGLAYAEMTALNLSHIQKGFDGKDWICIVREKTSNEVSVPVLPKAEQLMKSLEFYENNGFPKISNQRFNSYLKEIAFILDIEKRVTHHTARKTFASTVLLYNNVPMEVVQKLLGHSSITITEQSYGKILKKQVSEQMSKFY